MGFMHGLSEAGMWSWGMWWAMLLFWLVPILLVGGLLWGLVRSRDGGNSVVQEQGSPRDALDILKERYARSEISSEEFRRIRDDIQAGS